MEKTMMKFLFLILTLSWSCMGFSKSLVDDLEGLGANKEILKRARALSPHRRVRVVQNRSVDRNLRFEFSVNYGAIAGGDPYLETSSLGGQLEFHINPHWSVGMRYYDYSNALSAEGKRVFDYAAQNALVDPNVTVPELDSPFNSLFGTITWYPIYGKMNLFDKGISQFDLYLMAGYGKTETEKGLSNSLLAGGGVGLWLTQHMASRLEVRYQNYEDHVGEGRSIDWVTFTVSLGVLL
ncbi:MAG: outer membrane beta-barrel domain-containing protein [Bdellovibrio sp.]|nr:MAG: outer membrane beta-barrel domain-containing protein [Bdellovibrio sp.]